jgi:prevent-host-death family protein
MSFPQADESDRRSLQYFREHAEELAAAVRQTGQPIVLTDSNEGELVLQDAATYARMKAESEELATMRAIQAGLDDVAAGRTIPLAEAMEQLREEFGLRR